MRNIIKIKVEEGQTGYAAVYDWLVEYWSDLNHIPGDSVICLELSYDDKDYYRTNELVGLTGTFGWDVEWVNDWWEGQKYIKILGIKNVDDIDVVGCF